MKKVLIITLYGNNNFGNKLQNYALQQSIKKVKNNIDIETIKVNYERNISNKFLYLIWKVLTKIKNLKKKSVDSRELKFIEFSDNYIKYTKHFFGTNSNKKINGYDLYIYGSDQIWNPNGVGTSNLFIGALSDNNVSYAASIGSNSIPNQYLNRYKNNLSKFKYISIREEKGKEILEKFINRNDIEVLIDPTMLLTPDDWNNVLKKPKQIDNYKSKKYILNYFLGDLSESRKREIERIAKNNNCFVINILDRNDPFYECGPSEFLYLEKNAFLICTDSFHSSVFAFLYNRPFIIFNREDNEENMSSRLDTLVNIFKLKNRKYNGKNITKENLNHDYFESYKILELERRKSLLFLNKILNFGEKDYDR